jgi:hypothetical protein
LLDLHNLQLKRTPNRYLVAPRGFATATAHRRSPEFPWPSAGLAQRFCAAALFSLPDTISVEVIPLGENRKRIDRWLARLAETR